MAEKHCSHPGCYENSDSATMYIEQASRSDKEFAVCGKHADFTKDNVRAFVNSAASEMNDKILKTLQR